MIRQPPLQLEPDDSVLVALFWAAVIVAVSTVIVVTIMGW